MVEVTILRGTDKAYLFRNGSKEAWFPKSEVWFHTRNSYSQKAQADIPLWLLREKGW